MLKKRESYNHKLIWLNCQLLQLVQRLSLNSHLKASEFLLRPPKYFDGNSCLLRKAPQVFGRKTHHIHQFEKVYGMRTIITIVKANYCLMSQLLLNILSNVTLPPYPSFLYILNPFCQNCHATPKGHGLPPPPPKKKILNVH